MNYPAITEEDLSTRLKRRFSVKQRYLESVNVLSQYFFPRVMSLKQYFRSPYGCSSGVLAGQYSSCLEKLSRFKNPVAFSARCKKQDVIPPSLRIRPLVNTMRGRGVSMPVSDFSVCHSTGLPVQCNVAVCAFCHTKWQVSFGYISHGVLSVNYNYNA